MPIQPGLDSEAMVTPPPIETCVVLRLEFGRCSREDLLDWAAVVQEVVDRRAGEAAPDAAIRCIYNPTSVEILFTVENATQAEVHRRVAVVIAAVESVVPTRFDTDTATRAADPRELVPA